MTGTAPVAAAPAGIDAGHPAMPPAGGIDAGRILGDFQYVIREPRGATRIGHIEARSWPTDPVTVDGGFDEAVAQARKAASELVMDGIHRQPIHVAHGVLQGRDGSFQVAPLGGFHREMDAPLFIDGPFWDRTGLGVVVSRRTPELAAVVGGTELIDLRSRAAGAVINPRPHPNHPGMPGHPGHPGRPGRPGRPPVD